MRIDPGTSSRLHGAPAPRPWALAGSALVASLALGCGAQRAVLTPAPGAQTAAGSRVAVAQADGVTLRVEPGAWPGPRSVETAVTPLKVTFENNGTRPVAIRYDHVALVTQDGKRLTALPPFQAQREAAGTVIPPAPLTDLRFGYRRFFVAPHLRWYYSRLSPFRSPFLYDRLYYDRYVDYWASRHIAMEQVRRNAIPEGVLEPGGQITGYLYFEDVADEDVLQVTFHADLVDAATGDALARVEVPFNVSRA